MDKGSAFEIGGPGSISSCVRNIHLRTNTLGSFMNTALLPPTMW